MKIYIPLFLVAIGLFSTTYSQANNNSMGADWDNAVQKNTAFVSYKKAHDPDGFRSITVSIGHSKNGEQRLYIKPFSFDKHPRCNTYSGPDTITMTFNDQAVKMLKFCSDYTDSNSAYYTYTPATEKGLLFIVNLFKTSTTPIKLTFDGDTVYVPVRGFTRAWNSSGGNAI